MIEENDHGKKKRSVEYDVTERYLRYLGIKRRKEEQKIIDNWKYAPRGYMFEGGETMLVSYENFKDVEN